MENIEIIDYSEKAIAVKGETKPIKEDLKKLGGRFNAKLTCGPAWIFAKTKREALEAFLGGEVAVTELSKQKKEDKPKVNKFGVKVGDIFHMSWGYDQTNNDFFQVVALCGEQSVRVRDVNLKFESSNQGFMSEDRTFEIPQNGEMAEYSERSVWIKDQEKGDIKRLKDDGCPYFDMGNHWCKKVSGERITCYESWYA